MTRTAVLQPAAEVGPETAGGDYKYTPLAMDDGSDKGKSSRKKKAPTKSYPKLRSGSSVSGCLRISTQQESVDSEYKGGAAPSKGVKRGLPRNGTREVAIKSADPGAARGQGEQDEGSEEGPVVQPTSQSQVKGESSSEKSTETDVKPVVASNGGANRPVKQLSWGQVEIRNYDVTLGDSPACLAGVPIQLAWKYAEEETISVPLVVYETHRPPRRTGRQLFLNREVRDKMLLQYGYKRSEIARAVRQANIDRQARRTTVMNMKFTWMHEMMERFGRGAKKTLCRYSEKKAIERLYQKAEKRMQASSSSSQQ